MVKTHFEEQSLSIMLDDTVLLSATWDSYTDRNYHCEVITECIVEIPSIGCVLVFTDADEAQRLIETLCLSRELRADEFEIIGNLFPYVSVVHDHDSWECECCGYITDITTFILNGNSRESFQCYQDGHFADSESITANRLVQFCVDGAAIV